MSNISFGTQRLHVELSEAAYNRDPNTGNVRYAGLGSEKIFAKLTNRFEIGLPVNEDCVFVHTFTDRQTEDIYVVGRGSDEGSDVMECLGFGTGTGLRMAHLVARE